MSTAHSSSGATSAFHVHPTRVSDTTLTPGLDGASDYNEYLEKNSGHRTSLTLPPSVATEAGQQDHSILTSRPPSSETEHQEDSTDAGFPRIGSARQRMRREHRVERAEDPHEYPGPLPLFFLTVGICLSVFLVSLDRTIVATAIPSITNQFHSYDDVGWYGSAYLVTAGALQPLYGRIFILFNIKWSYLAALGIFELGSLICGIAPNSVTLIIGRAIAGWGSAGILTGSFVVVAHAVPLHRRPVFSACVGVMFGLGAIVGPLLGGVFTTLVTWRWCFYFNLPVGGGTVFAMVFCFKPHKDAQASDRPFFEKVFGLDLIGNFILIVAAVMLFLALQFNSEGQSWGGSKVVGLLVGAGVTTIIFILWQWRQRDRALLPGRIVLQRTVALSCLAAFFIYGTVLIHAYYLPIWFQAIKGANAIKSGVDLISYMAANALFSVFAGILVSKTGYYTPPAIIGAAIGCAGCGLLSTLQVDSGSAKWVGYQFLTSAGLGMAVQQGVIAVQTVLPLDLVPIGIAAIVSMQSLGGAVFVSVGNNILQNRLKSASAANELPGVNISKVLAVGATMFRSFVPKASLPALLNVYNSALQKVFIAAIPLSGLAFVVSLGLEWRSVKEKQASLEAVLAPATTEFSHSESLEASRSRRMSGESNPATEMRGAEVSEETPEESHLKNSSETARNTSQIQEVEGQKELAEEGQGPQIPDAEGQREITEEKEEEGLQIQDPDRRREVVGEKEEEGPQIQDADGQREMVEKKEEETRQSQEADGQRKMVEEKEEEEEGPQIQEAEARRETVETGEEPQIQGADSQKEIAEREERPPGTPPVASANADASQESLARSPHE